MTKWRKSNRHNTVVFLQPVWPLPNYEQKCNGAEVELKIYFMVNQIKNKMHFVRDSMNMVVSCLVT